MTDAETILKMIENVDPADTAKLDEIDALVWCWYQQEPFSKIGIIDALGIACFTLIRMEGKSLGAFAPTPAPAMR